MRTALTVVVPGLLARVSSASIEYLLRDDFVTDEAAPLASPRTCEPGPGTLTLVQTDGQMSVSGGVLQIPAQSSAVWGDLGFYEEGAGHPQQSGLFMLARITLSAINTFVAFGLHSTGGLLNPNIATTAGGFYFTGTGIRAYGGGAGFFHFGASYSSGVTYDIAVGVVGTDTLGLFIKGGAFADWSLIWVIPGATASSLWAVLSNFDAALTVDHLFKRMLGNRFATNFGITTVNVSAPTSGTTYTATADGIHDFMFTLPGSPSVGDKVELRYRVLDASNYMTAYLERNAGNTAWDFKVREVVAGTPATPTGWTDVTDAGTPARIRVIPVGSKHDFYTLSGTTWTKRDAQATSTNQQSATTINATYAAGTTSTTLRSYPRAYGSGDAPDSP